MPKSKRNKQIELAKTKKRGLDWKKRLLEEVRSCVDSYANVFVFSVNDMRNSKMKNVREQWRHSRFFIGKNKIMAMALGRFEEEEYKPNLHKIGQEIKGQRGLLFSNKSTEEVLNWFRSYSEGDYARSGNISTEDVNLPAGPLERFPHSLEPYLRQLGLPTSLVKGVIHLVKDHEVCKAGDALTPETAKILKLLGYEMAEFHITIECVWSHDGSFVKFTECVDTDSKENSKKKKKNSIGKRNIKPVENPAVEIMELELDEKSDESEDEIADDSADENTESKDNAEAKTTETSTAPFTTSITVTSTPKVLNESSKETKKQEGEIEIIEDVNKNKFIDVLIENTTSNVKKGRPFSQKTPKAETKRASLAKTPDANSSLDSPVFRQLRNRSVKVNRKRNK